MEPARAALDAIGRLLDRGVEVEPMRRSEEPGRTLC